MGILQKLTSTLKIPKMQDLTDSPSKVKESLQRSKMNLVDMIILDSNYRAGDQVVGVKSRLGKIPIILTTTPSNLGFFEVGNFYNRTTQKEMVICVEDNCYTLDTNREIIDQEMNAYAAGDIGIEGYQLPILLNKLAYKVVKKNPNEKLNQTSDEEMTDLTPSLLYSLATAKLAKDVTDEDTSVVPVTILIGVLLGMALLAILQAFSN